MSGSDVVLLSEWAIHALLSLKSHKLNCVLPSIFIYCMPVYKKGESEHSSLRDYFHSTIDTLSKGIVFI